MPPALLAATRPFTDPVLVFAFIMLVLLVAPALSKRLRIPAVVGLIVAGALVGPSALNLLTRTETIEILGTLGLLYLMFMAGLSLDLQQFLASRNRSLGFGLLSFGIPQALGVSAALVVLDWTLLPALLLGSIVGTHTLIAYPQAQRLGLGRHPAVVMVAGATLVTDGLGLSVLAGVDAAHTGELGLGFWLLFAAKVSAFIAVALLALPRLGRWFFRHVELEPHTELVFLLLLLFGTSYLSELAGLAPIVGAFVAGLTLNRMVPNASGIMGRVDFVGEALFVPLFLLSVGLLVDFGVLAHSLHVWRIAAVFCGAVVVGKLAAALIAQRLFGLSRTATRVVLGLSTPQAAGTLAVTLVGYELGLFDGEAVNAVVLLILITCLLGPWLVGRFGRALALELEDAGGGRGEASARILIPLANPTTAGSLIDLATLLRPPGVPDPIYPLTVIQDGERVNEQVARNERLTADAVMHAVAAGAPVQPITRIDLNVAHAIVRAQKELRASTVVIGWSGQQSAQDRVFGGVLDQLLHQCDQTVVVSRLSHPLNTTSQVALILPSLVHRQPGFDSALREVKTLCQRLSAKLVLLVAPTDRQALAPRARAQRPQVPLELREVNQIIMPRDPEAALAGLVGERDLVVLMNARRDTLAWQRSMERLPGHVAAALPSHNLLVIHPAEAPLVGAEEVLEPVEPGDAAGAARGGRGALFESRRMKWVATHREREPLRDFVRHMLEVSEGTSAATREALTERLLDSSRPAPIEVRSGVVFLSARGGVEWSDAQVFVGTCDEGVPAPGLLAPARVVLALVSPAEQTAAQHLANLALIARAFLACESVERLSAVHTVAELRALLAGDAAPPG